MDRRPRDAEAHQLTVVSPHLDDAVFACGDLLAATPGAVVVTVFAGVPPADRALPEWDATCGFRSAKQAMLARRREDRAAMTVLGARSYWLRYLDAQYRDGRQPVTLAARLVRALARFHPGRVAVPLGLFHEDHRLAHAAARTLIPARDDWEWIVYEDAIYRGIPGLADERCAELRRAGFALEPLAGSEQDARKRRAIACYASQLRGLASTGRPGHADAYAPEGLWRVRSASRAA